MLRTNQIASSRETAAQPTGQHDQQPAPEGVPSPQQPAHALSALVDLPRSPGRSGVSYAGTTGTEKRPLSPDTLNAAHAPEKKSRLHADLPSPADNRLNHGAGRAFGLATGGPGLSRTQGIQAVGSSHSSAEPMGGKVVDVANLPTLSGQPDEWTPTQIGEIKHTIETELTKKHGHPVKVLGYHVTPEHNVQSLRAEGFSAEKHQGKAGGVAGTNIHGPGLYISDHPTNDYARADGHDRMFAVVVPGNGFRKSGERPSEAWASGQQHSGDDTGHYMESMPGEHKILPSAIAEVGLVPIAHIPPSMSQALLAERANMLAKPVLPNGVSPELHKWITGAIAGHPALKNIETETDPEKKRASIQRVANQLDNDWAKPNDATRERLLTDLKARYSIPD